MRGNKEAPQMRGFFILPSSLVVVHGLNYKSLDRICSQNSHGHGFISSCEFSRTFLLSQDLL
jgi:hypothetical protein